MTIRILVTGSRGFIGGSVGRFASRAGHQVLGIARSSQPEADWPGRYGSADVLHTPLAEMIAKFSPDVLLHGAGTASVGASFATPLEDLRATVMTWANVLEGVRHSGVRPVILFPSSAAVYGNPATLPITEDAPIAPVSPYGFHKAACEWIAREYAECYGLNILICRLFSVFGPRQRRLLVWELFEQISGPEHVIHLQGTGQETRDYLFSEDLADVLLKIATHPACQVPRGTIQVLNVASGQETGVLDLAQQLGTLLASNKPLACRGTDRPGDPRRWAADVSGLSALLPDWQPRSLAAGLKQCLASWQATPPSDGAASHNR